MLKVGDRVSYLDYGAFLWKGTIIAVTDSHYLISWWQRNAYINNEEYRSLVPFFDLMLAPWSDGLGRMMNLCSK